MRKTKKLIAVILSVVTLFIATSVFAASEGSVASDLTKGVDTVQDAQTTYEDKGVGTSQTDVYLTIDNNNIVVGVPTTVIISGEPTSDGKYVGDYSVVAEGDINGTSKLYVAPDAQEIKVETEQKGYKKAVVSQEQISFNTSELSAGASTTGKVEAQSLTAGSWHGSFNFNIRLVDYANEVTIPSTSEATYIYVSPNGNDATADGSQANPYKSLYYANKSISDNSASNKYVIKLADGTYNDLESVYSTGSSELNAQQYWGYIAKDNVYYLGNPEHPENVVVDWDLTKGFEEYSQYKDKFAYTEIFHIYDGRTTAISGMTLNATNTLRAVHIETAGKSNKPCRYTISDCNINYWGRNIIDDATGEDIGEASTATIGCGGNNGDFGIYRNCNISNFSRGSGCEKIWNVHSNVKNKLSDDAFYQLENCHFYSANLVNNHYPVLSMDKTNTNFNNGTTILINCTAENADGNVPFRISNTNKAGIEIFAFCDSNSRNVSTSSLTVFSDLNNISFSIPEGSKEALSNRIDVQPNTTYRIQIIGGASNLYFSRCTVYKNRFRGVMSSSMYGGMERDFMITTKSEGTQIEFRVLHKGGTAISQSELNDIKILITEF